mmetsp:Transcript_12890/g.34343  ORF Transcript_12890/g.34343 Transcript_12890/m.34343 type:complete len:366 (-) Transcript_12890:1105-2202(-)
MLVLVGDEHATVRVRDVPPEAHVNVVGVLAQRNLHANDATAGRLLVVERRQRHQIVDRSDGLVGHLQYVGWRDPAQGQHVAHAEGEALHVRGIAHPVEDVAVVEPIGGGVGEAQVVPQLVDHHHDLATVAQRLATVAQGATGADPGHTLGADRVDLRRDHEHKIEILELVLRPKLRVPYQCVPRPLVQRREGQLACHLCPVVVEADNLWNDRRRDLELAIRHISELLDSCRDNLVPVQRHRVFHLMRIWRHRVVPALPIHDDNEQAFLTLCPARRGAPLRRQVQELWQARGLGRHQAGWRIHVPATTPRAQRRRRQRRDCAAHGGGARGSGVRGGAPGGGVGGSRRGQRRLRAGLGCAGLDRPRG